MPEELEDVKKKVIEHLRKVGKAKNKEVARALNLDKHLVDKAIGELGKEGKIEYIYLDSSYVKLKD